MAASSDGGLLVRTEPGETETLLRESGTRRFSMRGREMDGWLIVDAEGVASVAALQTWVDRGLAYSGSLPPK